MLAGQVVLYPDSLVNENNLRLRLNFQGSTNRTGVHFS